MPTIYLANLTWVVDIIGWTFLALVVLLIAAIIALAIWINHQSNIGKFDP